MNSGIFKELKDVNWVQFTNQIDSSNAGGTFKVSAAVFNSGEYYPFPDNPVDVETGQERLQVYHKHHDWNEEPAQFRLVLENFAGSQSTPLQFANFIRMEPASITNFLVSANVSDEGKIEFRDPWFVADANNTQPNTLFEYEDNGSIYYTQSPRGDYHHDWRNEVLLAGGYEGLASKIPASPPGARCAPWRIIPFPPVYIR